MMTQIATETPKAPPVRRGRKPLFYGVDFVAELFGVSEKTVYRWVSLGIELKGEKIGGAVRIPAHELRRKLRTMGIDDAL